MILAQYNPKSPCGGRQENRSQRTWDEDAEVEMMHFEVGGRGHWPENVGNF